MQRPSSTDPQTDYGSSAEAAQSSETAVGQDVLSNDVTDVVPNMHHDQTNPAVRPLDSSEPYSTVPYHQEDQGSQHVVPYLGGTTTASYLPYEYTTHELVAPPTYISADSLSQLFGDVEMLELPNVSGNLHAPPTYSSLSAQGRMSRVRRGYMAFIDFRRKPHIAVGASVVLRPAATVIIVSDLGAIFAYINLTIDRDGLHRLDLGHQMLQLMSLHSRHKETHFPVPGTRTICGLWLLPDSPESDAEVLQHALLGILLSPEVHVYRPHAGAPNLPGLAFTLLENGQGVVYLDNERIERVGS
ncbi:hypothetical protein CMQ_6915 [Grosmannia clavigera kw1407]|uniref:Uncharacterized protein n=1 Tax=Grosmannia clavigera (strain kw1407 / UAMH 11150) TaxID=655863 RepID=F0X6N1_GROCL|nr:uncharacterized protein CMQ_6915 [Grosmannia clavigera kw1407]EFX06594.1 hypothetical protein CMQ_6915 [Grosmannia clavigera kw1407]